jgi:hypothetical protein
MNAVVKEYLHCKSNKQFAEKVDKKTVFCRLSQKRKAALFRQLFI